MRFAISPNGLGSVPEEQNSEHLGARRDLGQEAVASCDQAHGFPLNPTDKSVRSIIGAQVLMSPLRKVLFHPGLEKGILRRIDQSRGTRLEYFLRHLLLVFERVGIRPVKRKKKNITRSRNSARVEKEFGLRSKDVHLIVWLCHLPQALGQRRNDFKVTFGINLLKSRRERVRD